MHTNYNLTFNNNFRFEVFHDSDTPTVEILINNVSKYKETFSANTVHKKEIQFDFEYADRNRNDLQIKFSGSSESANRYLKLNRVVVHGNHIETLNSYYYPALNEEWWDSLTVDEKEKYKEMIYGNMGNTFGWYGDIHLYYHTGVDSLSMYRGSNDNTDILLNVKPRWILLDKSNIKKPYEGFNDG